MQSAIFCKVYKFVGN